LPQRKVEDVLWDQTFGSTSLYLKRCTLDSIAHTSWVNGTNKKEYSIIMLGEEAELLEMY